MRYLFIIVLTLLPICTLTAQENSVLPPADHTLSQNVITATNKILMCAKKEGIEHNNILTIIDYSLPSTDKRLWVFDLNTNKMLYHTYVSHAMKSGLFTPDYFSNTRNSQSNSLGVFKTDFSYDGRYGMAVKLQGLENSFNDNAYDRFIVIHPAWYVSEDFIRKYGRLGRSWGCPAISPELNDKIIDTIKDNSLVIVYYPSAKWLSKSHFLNCDELALTDQIKPITLTPKSAASEKRAPILFTDNNNNHKRDKIEPIIVMSAENYKKIYQKDVPMSRMLRRQFNKTEYIALTRAELDQLDSNSDHFINKLDKNGLNVIDFVIAEVKNKNGYWATEFKSVKSKTEKEINLKNKTLKPTEKFIRWLGI